jgi:hypothetical protein
MKKTFKNTDFKNNEILSNSTTVKGGKTNSGITAIIVERKAGVIIDNIIGRTKVIEDNVMV